MHATFPLLQTTDFPPIRRAQLTTLQVNLGYLCNQACVHCHINAGPKRTELMKQDTVEAVLAFLRAKPQVRTLDLTGGAPELNADFRYLVERARAETRQATPPSPGVVALRLLERREATAGLQTCPQQ